LVFGAEIGERKPTASKSIIGAARESRHHVRSRLMIEDLFYNQSRRAIDVVSDAPHVAFERWSAARDFNISIFVELAWALNINPGNVRFRKNEPEVRLEGSPGPLMAGNLSRERLPIFAQADLAWFVGERSAISLFDSRKVPVLKNLFPVSVNRES
jgi:hypothetical protein